MTLFDDVRLSLKAAYFDKETRPSPGDGWQAETMRAIRCMGPLNKVSERLMDAVAAERMVWRFAGAASVLAMATAIYYFGYQTGVGYELTRLFVDDPIGMGLIQSFGLL